MSKKQQLLDLIGSIEDEALKTKLSTVADGAFTDIESIKNDAIESRDKVKDKLKASNSMLNDIKSELKLDDDFQVTDITERIKKNSNTDEIEARFETDLKTVRDELLQSQQANTDLTTKFNDTLFTNGINASGELTNFVNDPMAQKMILGEYRNKTIMEDGNLYKRDEITGKIATDAISGDRLGIDSVTKDILGAVSDIYKNPEVVANGGGSTQTVATGSKKPNEMTGSERTALFRSNPTEFKRLFPTT